MARSATWIALSLIGFMLVLSALAWPSLPDAASVPVHWREGLRPNRFVGRDAGVALLPLVALSVTWLMWLAGRTRSELAEELGFSTACSWASMVVTMMLAAAHAYVLLTALGREHAGPLVLSMAPLALLGGLLVAARSRLYGVLLSGLALSLFLGAFAGAFRLAPVALYAILAGAGGPAGIHATNLWRRSFGSPRR